jgi:hypothetical protein
MTTTCSCAIEANKGKCTGRRLAQTRVVPHYPGHSSNTSASTQEHNPYRGSSLYSTKSTCARAHKRELSHASQRAEQTPRSAFQLSEWQKKQPLWDHTLTRAGSLAVSQKATTTSAWFTIYSMAFSPSESYSGTQCKLIRLHACYAQWTKTRLLSA